MAVTRIAMLGVCVLTWPTPGAARAEVAQAVEEAGVAGQVAEEGVAPGNAPGDAPDDAPEDAAEPAAEVEPIDLEALPHNVSSNASLSFDEQGNLQHQNHNLSVNLHCFMPADVHVISYRMGELDPAVTSAGEKLTPSSHHGTHWQQVHDHMRRQGRPKFYVNFSLTPPTLPADTLQRVAGEVELMTAVGPKRRAVLGPIEEVDGKTAEIRGVEDCRIRVQRTGDHAFRVDYIGRGWELLDEAKFYTAEGVELSPNGWSGGGHVNNGRYHREYRMGMPDGGKVVVDLWAEKRVVPGRFEVADVPLPGALEADRVDLAIDAEPIEDAQAVGGVGMGDAGAGAEPLDVVILDDAG